MKGEKIGEDKYNERWSLDGHSYVEVPKWVVEQVREEVKEEVREGLKTMRPILWNDDPKRHVGNITKYNTIDEVLQLLETLENNQP